MRDTPGTPRYWCIAGRLELAVQKNTSGVVEAKCYLVPQPEQLLQMVLGSINDKWALQTFGWAPRNRFVADDIWDRNEFPGVRRYMPSALLMVVDASVTPRRRASITTSSLC